MFNMGKTAATNRRDGKSSIARSKTARAVTDALANSRAAKKRPPAPPIEESDDEGADGAGSDRDDGNGNGDYDDEDKFGQDKVLGDDDNDILKDDDEENGPNESNEDSEDELAKTKRQLAKLTKSNLELRDVLIKLVPELVGSNKNSTVELQTSNVEMVAIPPNRSTMCIDELQGYMGIQGNEARWRETRTNARDITGKAGFDLDIPWGSQETSKKTDAAFALRQAIPEFEPFVNNWGAQHLIQETFNHRRNRILSRIAQEKKKAKERAERGDSSPSPDPGPKVDKRKRAYRAAHGDKRKKSGNKSADKSNNPADKSAGKPADASRPSGPSRPRLRSPSRTPSRTPSRAQSQPPTRSPSAPPPPPPSKAPPKSRPRKGAAASGSAPDPLPSVAKRQETRASASKAATEQVDREDPPPPTATSTKRKRGGATKGNTPAKKTKTKV